MRLAYPDRPDWHICHETIYQALYQGGKGGHQPAAHPPTAHRAALRKRRRRAGQRRIALEPPVGRGQVSRAVETDREMLKKLKVTLDRCWDLLGQRRARRAAGLDPEEAWVRDEQTVEGYPE